MEFDGEKVVFQLAPPAENVVKLAFPVPHPWLRGEEVEEVGMLDEVPAGAALVDANVKAARLAEGKAPENLKDAAKKHLAERVAEYFEDLVRPEDVCFSAGLAAWPPDEEAGPRRGERKQHRVLFSGRSVITPDGELGFDQLGLPDEMAWELFGPLAMREIGEEEIEKRTERAGEVLDAVMARSWLLLNRAPTILPTGMIACHPMRTKGRVIRISPLICLAMNADFDGDQAAVFLPVTEKGQREAGEKLSVAGHLRRDPSLLRLFCPTHEMIWGLCNLSLAPEGRAKVSKILEIPLNMSEQYLTRSAVITAMEQVMKGDGVEKTLKVLEELMALGFKAAKSSGSSISPFIGEGLHIPKAPEIDNVAAWEGYAEEVHDAIMSLGDFENDDHGAQLLAVKSGARGSVASMARLIGPFGVLKNAEGKAAIIRRSFSQGLKPDEMNAHTAVARKALWQLVANLQGSIRAGYGSSEPAKSTGYGILARSMRAKHPGVVLARAAERGEVDPLTDIDSRLFVGLLPLGIRNP